MYVTETISHSGTAGTSPVPCASVATNVASLLAIHEDVLPVPDLDTEDNESVSQQHVDLVPVVPVDLVDVIYLHAAKNMANLCIGFKRDADLVYCSNGVVDKCARPQQELMLLSDLRRQKMKQRKRRARARKRRASRRCKSSSQTCSPQVASKPSCPSPIDEPPCWIHASGFSNQVNAKQVQNYVSFKLKRTDVICRPLFPSNSDPTDYSRLSFKIGVPPILADVVLEPSFWAPRVRARRFIDDEDFRNKRQRLHSLQKPTANHQRIPTPPCHHCGHQTHK